MTINLKPKAKYDTKIEYTAKAMPLVFVSREALSKMQAYIDGCNDEIGWLGTATRNGNIFTIHDTYLFKQRVHATTTEITPEGLTEFAEELLQQPNGVTIWNEMRMWGHSHVNMGVSPSGQDDKQMTEFEKGGHDWFIRLIGNKKGDMRIDIYDYKGGFTYKDVQWSTERSQEEEDLFRLGEELKKQFNEQIKLIQEQLDAVRSTRYVEVKASIEAEIKEKVSKIGNSYTTWSNRGAITTGNRMYAYANAYGRYVNSVWKTWATLPPTREEFYEHYAKLNNELYFDCIALYGDPEAITDAGDITFNPYDLFTLRDIQDMAHITGKEELLTYLEDFGYERKEFSDDDVTVMLKEINIVANRIRTV